MADRKSKATRNAPISHGSQSVGREQFLGGSLTVNLRITSSVWFYSRLIYVTCPSLLHITYKSHQHTNHTSQHNRSLITTSTTSLFNFTKKFANQCAVIIDGIDNIHANTLDNFFHFQAIEKATVQLEEREQTNFQALSHLYIKSEIAKHCNTANVCNWTTSNM
ncbi:hypothetical protein T12_246 [Trichinella patagoniensis]|uniref:Uncharacterized protein n=1 Tax=Trichinella patagoniensis TaxID=990121 RepID=A0A0V0ZVH7_9BILA|nr:hypothetical protein T12_246 [Trichinella patagoniensis]